MYELPPLKIKINYLSLKRSIPDEYSLYVPAVHPITAEVSYCLFCIIYLNMNRLYCYDTRLFNRILVNSYIKALQPTKSFASISLLKIPPYEYAYISTTHCMYGICVFFIPPL